MQKQVKIGMTTENQVLWQKQSAELEAEVVVINYIQS